jgi:hypothetical protein
LPSQVVEREVLDRSGDRDARVVEEAEQTLVYFFILKINLTPFLPHLFLPFLDLRP